MNNEKNVALMPMKANVECGQKFLIERKVGMTSNGRYCCRWEFIGAVQPLHLVEGSNTDEFFVAAQWKQYPCWQFVPANLSN
jgi:hypothetical protein